MKIVQRMTFGKLPYGLTHYFDGTDGGGALCGEWPAPYETWCWVVGNEPPRVVEVTCPKCMMLFSEPYP